jgi:hypothetical protein
MADEADVLLAIYEENAEQARHHEKLREAITGAVAAITVGVHAVVFKADTPHSPGLIGRPALALGFFLGAIGIAGLVGARYHSYRNYQHRKRLDRAKLQLFKLPTLPLLPAGLASKNAPVFSIVGTHTLWELIHVCVIFLGGYIVFCAYCSCGF